MKNWEMLLMIDDSRNNKLSQIFLCWFPFTFHFISPYSRCNFGTPSSVGLDDIINNIPTDETTKFDN